MSVEVALTVILFLMITVAGLGEGIEEWVRDRRMNRHYETAADLLS